MIEKLKGGVKHYGWLKMILATVAITFFIMGLIVSIVFASLIVMEKYDRRYLNSKHNNTSLNVNDTLFFSQKEKTKSL